MQILRRLLSKRVVRDASNSVRGYCRGKSIDSVSVKRIPKRIPKDERKAMVEAFVNKYRAINGGKFPPAMHTMKEVGGSYYTIKKFIQELQYNSKMQVEHKGTVVEEASAGKDAPRKDDLLIKVEEILSRETVVKNGECKDGQLMKEAAQNRKPSVEVKEILRNQRTIDAGISQEAQLSTIGGMDGEHTNSIREAQAKGETPIAADNTILQENLRISGRDNKVAAAPVIEPELKTSSHSKEPENSIKQKVSPTENFKVDGPTQMDEQKHSPELENPIREISNEHKADTQTESKSSMWENLKSLADGILNMWRK